MSDFDDDSSDEGRIALHLLSRQLKDTDNDDIGSVSSSRQASLSSERKLLDRSPRDVRLSYRMDSPLGLTLEALADRGLLDGGACVPLYHTSLKHKIRRALEFKNRALRLQHRDSSQSDSIRQLSNVAHMIRVLVKRGLQLNAWCTARDPSRQGEIDRESFVQFLRQTGLPYTSQQLKLILKPYQVSSRKYIDYVSFLKFVGLHHAKSGQLTDNGLRISDPFEPVHVVDNIKLMILDSSTSLGRGFDDVYKIFARWDTEGTGLITATQFLRALNRLHVQLTDAEQDLIVELLDTDGVGKVDFESLLTFCFVDLFPQLVSSTAKLSLRSLCELNKLDRNLDERSIGGNSTSDWKSSSSEQSPIIHITKKDLDRRRPMSSQIRRDSNDFDGSSDGTKDDQFRQERIKPYAARNRPLTASARVSMNTHAKTRRSVDNNHRIIADKIQNDEVHDGNGFQNRSSNFGANGNGERVSFSPSDNGRTGPITSPISSNLRNSSISPASRKYPPISLSNSENQADHFALLAKQSLQTIREICLTSLHSGKSIQDIFYFFNRKSKGPYFDLQDFVSAASELHIDLSDEVANIAFRDIVTDGYDNGTYGDLKTFVFDPNFKELQSSIEEQLVSQLQTRGKTLLNDMKVMFRCENHDIFQQNRSTEIYVPVEVFIQGIQSLNISVQSANDFDRLIQKFDNEGNHLTCSISRFLSMITSNYGWIKAVAAIEYQERSSMETYQLRKQMNDGISSPMTQGISEEILNMAEYLGICPISERHLLWIAVNACNAALPENWTIQSDENGRNFYFNAVTRQSQWEHPLDPYFRQLRDQNRVSRNNDVTSEQIDGLKLGFSEESTLAQQPSSASIPELEVPYPANTILPVELPKSSLKPRSPTISSTGCAVVSDAVNHNDLFQNTVKFNYVQSRMNVIDNIYSTPYFEAPNIPFSFKTQDPTKIKYFDWKLTSETYRPVSRSRKKPSKSATRPMTAVDRLTNISSKESPLFSKTMKAALYGRSSNSNNHDLANLPDINRYRHESPLRRPSNMFDKDTRKNEKHDEVNDRCNQMEAFNVKKTIRDSHLAEMFDSNLIRRLDNIILPRTGSKANENPSKSVPTHNSGQGGIVLL